MGSSSLRIVLWWALGPVGDGDADRINIGVGGGHGVDGDGEETRVRRVGEMGEWEFHLPVPVFCFLEVCFWSVSGSESESCMMMKS